MNKRLYNSCQKLNLSINNAFEIGVYYPENCSLNDFIDRGIDCTLIEADPACAQKLREHFMNYKNVKVLNKAVWDKNETVSLYRAKSSTFIENISGSPAVVNDSYIPSDSDKFTAEGIRFSTVDDGKIDLLLIDIEGAEWFALKHLNSRPKVISLEIEAGLYRNPYYNEIERWLKKNSYLLWFKNDTDFVYIKEGAAKFGTLYLTELFLHNLRETAKQKIKFLKKKLRKSIS